MVRGAIRRQLGIEGTSCVRGRKRAPKGLKWMLLRLLRPDCATLKRQHVKKAFRPRLLPSNPLPFFQLNPTCQARNIHFPNRKCKRYSHSKFIFYITQAMTGFTDNNEDDFNAQMLAAIESNDLATLHDVMSKHEAEDPDALRRGNGLSDALNEALELARYDMAEELFKRGARCTDCTIGYVLDGARRENEWNTKAIDVALAYGWNINEPYEHVGSALV